MAALHPQVVHFAIALLIVGVALRAASLLRWTAFVSPAAFLLLLLGTIAAAVAVNSGTAAHGPVEQIPGLRAVVGTHEDWGERTQYVFFVVLAIELVGLALWRSPRKRTVDIASLVVGLVGLVCLFQAGQAGGRIVYSYAGGIGIRSGDPKDVDRLLLAGMYEKAMQDRKAGQSADAAALLAEAGQRYGSDIEVQLVAAESLLRDRRDATAALAALKNIQPPRDNRALRIRHALLTADALDAAGQREGAAAVVQGLLTEYPDNPRLKQRLQQLRTQ